MQTSLQAATIVLVVTFLAYLAAILRSYLRRPPSGTGDPDAFDWHLFVPARDEAVVIDSTLQDLRASFPAAHVWVIDDDSDDATAEIAADWVARDGHVHLVQRRRPEARTGKGDALNSAYHQLASYLSDDADHAKIVVGVVDADGRLAPDVFDYIAGPSAFGDERVGAAQISVWMHNREDRTPRPGRGRLSNAFARTLVRLQDVEFRTTIAAMQLLRMKTLSVALGGNGQFTRLSALDSIAASAGEPWHGALLEDYELGLHVMLAGYENRYIDDTHVSQEAVSDLRRLLRQRTRWAQGNIQCVKYLPELIRSRHFSSAGLLEAAYFLVLPYFQLLGVILWPLSFAVVFYETLQINGGAATWFANVWPLVLLVLLVGVLPFAMWGPLYRRRCEPNVSRRQAWAWGLGMWAYLYYMYLTTPRAFARILLRRSGWDKTRRNADPAHPPVPSPGAPSIPAAPALTGEMPLSAFQALVHTPTGGEVVALVDREPALLAAPQCSELLAAAGDRQLRAPRGLVSRVPALPPAPAIQGDPGKATRKAGTEPRSVVFGRAIRHAAEKRSGSLAQAIRHAAAAKRSTTPSAVAARRRPGEATRPQPVPYRRLNEPTEGRAKGDGTTIPNIDDVDTGVTVGKP